jgi:hypothetical protein
MPGSYIRLVVWGKDNTFAEIADNASRRLGQTVVFEHDAFRSVRSLESSRHIREMQFLRQVISFSDTRQSVALWRRKSPRQELCRARITCRHRFTLQSDQSWEEIRELKHFKAVDLLQ